MTLFIYSKRERKEEKITRDFFHEFFPPGLGGIPAKKLSFFFAS